MNIPLWKPSPERIQKANMSAFIRYVNNTYAQDLKNYDELYLWSIHEPEQFWSSFWNFSNIISSKVYTKVVESDSEMINTHWFAGAKLNFAQNLLRFRDEQTAIIFKGEHLEPERLSYAELYQKVAVLAQALKRIGVAVGDRVVGFMPNMTETVIAMLAVTSLGAIWSSCSPDFGLKGALDRFGQISPKVLFTADGYYYGGKAFNSLPKVKEITEKIPEIERIIVVPYTTKEPDLGQISKAILYQDFILPPKDSYSASDTTSGLEIEFTQLPFDHPVYIMYSSGTTGVPKCIVHGAGGTLIQHLKELILHTDLKREDKIFYYTTCGWMMWNWLISSLAVGATIVLYDGSPFFPNPGTLWQFAQDERITLFGTSAKYLSSLEKSKIKPGITYNLSSLKAVLSTGSPLSEDNFRFVYRDIKQDLCLSSISGGTDIISCFALGNPILPVYPGELQCRGLGMKVESFDPDGKALINKKGELVCTAPFPSMPVSFWNDPDQSKYHKAYFEVYPNIWHHGDYIEITDNGGVIIYGRSDATLNPGGVRIGTAEIYRQVEGFSEILDSIVVGQQWEGDTRIILFVKLASGNKLTEDLRSRIIMSIRDNTTPRHVPAKIIEVSDIPYTLNGKKVELAVQKMIHGEPVLNLEALANPTVLSLFQRLPELEF